MKQKKLKGFTLIEMIIVMVLMSLIMYSVVQLINPVSKYFTRSANYENATSCLDNLKRAIEGNLKYADRVRTYNGFAPYTYSDATSSNGAAILVSDYTATFDLEDKVQEFYDTFFADRTFLGTAGNIYVLVFDNTKLIDGDVHENGPAEGEALANYELLNDFTDDQLNGGKLVRYTYWFNNHDGGLDLSGSSSPEVWYVNQKLYGAYEYQFDLRSTDASDDEEDEDAEASFDPANCMIRITANEIRKSGTGLFRYNVYQRSEASFSMKNVLDATQKYTSPLNDVKVFENTSAADTLERFYVDVNQPPIPRYAAMQTNSGTDAFDGFYFIYTLPDMVYDDADLGAVLNDGIDYMADKADYINEVNTRYNENLD